MLTIVELEGLGKVNEGTDGGVVWDSLDQYNNLFQFNDLFRAAPGTHAP